MTPLHIKLLDFRVLGATLFLFC